MHVESTAISDIDYDAQRAKLFVRFSLLQSIFDFSLFPPRISHH